MGDKPGKYVGTWMEPDEYAHLVSLARLAKCSIAEAVRRIVTRAKPEDVLPVVPSGLTEALGECERKED